METLGYYNGDYGPLEEMTIPMLDRACYFGDGIYDATPAKNHVVYLMEEHIERFFGNLAKIRIAPPCTKAELGALLTELLAKVDADECLVYWQSSRGVALRNHPFPDEAKTSLMIMIRPWTLPDLSRRQKLVSMEDTRYLHCDMKTINLLPSVLAAQYARDNGCDETVFHRGERVTECAHCNIHMIKDGVLHSAPTDNLILPGIARRHLFAAARHQGLDICEEPFTLDQLHQADEVLITSSGTFCFAAATLDGLPVGGKAQAQVEAIQTELENEFLRYVGVLRD